MKHKLTLGIGLTLLGAFLYSAQTAIVKSQTGMLPALPVVIFIQSLISLLLMLPIMFRSGLSHALAITQTKNLKLQIIRTIFSLGLSYLLFYAVKFIPLVNGMLLTNTAPLIVPLIAYLFLAQPINHRLWIPILIGFTGVTIVLGPSLHVFNWGSLMAMGAAVCMASTILAVRKLTETDSTETNTFYFFLFSTLISGVISLNFWQPITVTMWEIMLAIGVLYFIVQFVTTHAIKFINAQLMSILFYSNIIFAAAIAWGVWHTAPSLLTWVGVAFIITGGVLCIRIEKQLNKLGQHYGELHLASNQS